MTEEEKYCETCNHIEMCKWTPISGCAFHSKYEQRPHGEWKKDGFFAICSSCCLELQHYELVVSWLNFCPNCGADMRKRGE